VVASSRGRHRPPDPELAHDADGDPAEIGGRRGRRALQAAAVCLGYLLVSFIMFGLPIFHAFSIRAAGDGSGDTKLYAWAMGWWPYALSHHVSPLHTNLIWAPWGIDLTWVTTLPGPALVMWPVTSKFGPVAALNVLSVVAPALNGWAAFLLCRRASGGRLWPAVAGGFLFGFSAYMVAELLGHVNLFLVFPVPLAAYLTVRALDGSMRRWSFAVLLGLVIVVEFSISTEIAATMVMFGAFAFMGAIALAPDLRGRLLRLLPWIVAAGALAAILLSPYLVEAARSAPAKTLKRAASGAGSVNLLSYLFPRQMILLGGLALRNTTRAFGSNASEDGAYLTPTLIVALVLAGWTLRRDRLTRNVLVFFLLAAVLSLGAYLRVGSPTHLVPMPWYLGARAPLLHDAQPMRFTMYAWLAVAVVVARWLADRETSLLRWGLVGMSAVLLIPATARAPWQHNELLTPTFFSSDQVRAIPEGEIVLIIHYKRRNGGPSGDSDAMLWQEAADFRFAMPEGYTGPQKVISFPLCRVDCANQRFIDSSVWLMISRNELAVLSASQLRLWLSAHDVGAVILVDGADTRWAPLLAITTGSSGRRLTGVTIYDMPP
jgi:hypothetical protein